MSLGYPNQNGGRTTDAALFHALGNVFKGTWVSGFKVRQNSPLGMSVRVGGESSTPDDLLVRDGSGATFPVCNLSSQPVVATVATANSANPRIDSVVVYIDSAVAANHTAANNQNRTKVAVVSGTPATSPSAPSASQIKSVVGSNSPYVVLADIRVNRAVTSISDANITDRREAVRLNHAPVISDSAQLADDIVLPRHMKTDAAVVRLDSRLYSNTGSNKARLKDTISQRGNITIDSSNNEIVIGDQVKEVEVVATVMAEQLATYLFVIVQRKKQGAGYEQITHSLNAPHQGYAGATISATIPVVRGDRISILHDCTGQIRGQYSQIAVRATR